MTNASIITIGDELLIGQVIDTNSAWIAQQLNKAGIRVKRRVSVGDVFDEIWNALDEETLHSDIILITGGLGPTSDDITKPLLCKYFGGKMVINDEALRNVKYLFEQVFKRPVTESNFKQAEVPDNCTVIPNMRGTAPGMLFEKNGKIFISMPGVPYEMQGMVQNNVIKILLEKFNSSAIQHRTLITFGVGESTIADLLQHFEMELPEYIKLAYLPNYGMVRLRLSATGANKEAINEAINIQFETMKELVKEYLIAIDDESMEKIIGNLLLAKGKTVSTAESCTGGYIAHLLTALPGSSAWYDGSVVSYSYQAKEDLLNVKHSTLLQHGAVSEEVVREMAKGLLKKIHADYAIAVSGIMGPAGGLPDKPVGTVWVAVGNAHKIVAHKFHFRFDRKKNIELTAMNALNLLRKFILEND